jgi:multidrug resistance efflux pump
MKTSKRSLVFGFVTLGVLAAVTIVGSLLLQDPYPRDRALFGKPASQTSGAEETPDVVCFGYVDVEPGVTSLAPVQPGRVVEVNVRENDPVSAGAPLLRLDEDLFRIKIRQAEADLAAARAQVLQLRNLPEQHKARLLQQQAGIEAASNRLAAGRQVLTRKQHLYERNLLALEDLRATAESVKELEAAVRAEQEKLADLKGVDPAAEIARAEAGVAGREAQLAEARHHLDECTLRAPEAGKVLRIQVGVGDVLTGQPGQPVILFCPAKRRIVRAEVNQEFAGRVALGQPVRLEEDCNGKDTWHGKVVRLSDWYTRRRSVLNEPLQFNDVRTLECIVELDPNQPLPRIGQRMRVKI